MRFGITMERPAGYPGSAVVWQERCQVTIAVETRTPDAKLVYRRDNEVRVQGELDCVLATVPSGEDAAAIQHIKAQWEALRPQLANDPREQEAAYRRYLGQLRRFADTPRWRILAGHIAASGEAIPISQGEARRQRRELSQERDGRRPRPPVVATAPDQLGDLISSEGTEPIAQESEDTLPRRRRRTQEAAAIAAPEEAAHDPDTVV